MIGVRTVRFLQALILPGALLAIWQLAATYELLSPAYFPEPIETFDVLYESVSAGSLTGPFLATTARMFQGWFIASVLGMILGGLISSSERARDYLLPTIEFLRPFPASAIIPAVILALGLSNSMAVTVIAFGAIWPVLLNTIHGFSAVEPRLKEVAAMLDFSQAKYIRKMVLPSALPDIFTGLRVSLAISLILAVVVEMQGAQQGLGQNILLAQRLFRSPELYAGIVVLGLLGFAISVVLDRIEGRLLRWKVQR